MLGYHVEKRECTVCSGSQSGPLAGAGAGTQHPAAGRAPSPHRTGSRGGPGEPPAGEGVGSQPPDDPALAQALYPGGPHGPAAGCAPSGPPEAPGGRPDRGHRERDAAHDAPSRDPLERPDDGADPAGESRDGAPHLARARLAAASDEDLQAEPRFSLRAQAARRGGVYLHPPDKALVLCVDEKSQIQALERSQPILPLRPGIPAWQPHDDARHGTTTLFAALNVLEGTVVGTCLPRHRHSEFLTFLERIDRTTPRRREIPLILDNDGTHTHPKVAAWFAAHPRTPSKRSASRGYPSTSLRVNAPSVDIQSWAHLEAPGSS